MSLGLTIGVIAFCLFIASLFMLSLGKCASKPMPTIDEDLGAGGGLGVDAKTPGEASAASSISLRPTPVKHGERDRELRPGPSAPTFNPMNRFPAGRWTIPPGKLTKILK